MHVSTVKHLKTNQGEGKNWLYAGNFNRKDEVPGSKESQFYSLPFEQAVASM